jgi:hypothetical protein
MTQAATTYEMSANFYETTRCKNPEEKTHLHTRRRENLKSHKLYRNFRFPKQMTE